MDLKNIAKHIRIAMNKMIVNSMISDFSQMFIHKISNGMPNNKMEGGNTVKVRMDKDSRSLEGSVS